MARSRCKLCTNNGLLINATGNSSGSDPVDFQNVTDSNRRAWLFVTAVQPNGDAYNIATYANQCGQAMDFCVTAPGTNFIWNYTIEQQTASVGTSSSTAVVTGLAATILEKWPQLTGQQVGQIIMNTARDLGAPGTDPVFGRGLVDFQAALSPIDPKINVGSTPVEFSEDILIVPSAFGTGKSGNTGGNGTDGGDSTLASVFDDITIIDAYGRDFQGLGGLAVSADALKNRDVGSLSRQMEAMGNASTAGFVTPNMSASISGTRYRMFDAGYENQNIYANRLTNANFMVRLGGASDVTVTARFNGSDDIQNDIMGLAPTSDIVRAYAPGTGTSMSLAKPVLGGNASVTTHASQNGEVKSRATVVSFDDDHWGLRMGVANEDGGVFGTPTGLGALRLADGSKSQFIEANTNWMVGNFHVNGYGSLGFTRLNMAEGSIFTDASQIKTMRWGVTAGHPLAGGMMTFGVAQPLTVIDGTATINTGFGYDSQTNQLIVGERQVKLNGQARVQLTAGYEMIGDRSALRFGVAHGLQDGDVQGVATYTRRF